MEIYRDYDLRWKIKGYEDISFTTRGDAEEAAELADRHTRSLISQAMAQESRYRRAASLAQSGVSNEQ